MTTMHTAGMSALESRMTIVGSGRAAGTAVGELLAFSCTHAPQIGEPVGSPDDSE